MNFEVLWLFASFFRKNLIFHQFLKKFSTAKVFQLYGSPIPVKHAIPIVAPMKQTPHPYVSINSLSHSRTFIIIGMKLELAIFKKKFSWFWASNGPTLFGDESVERYHCTIRTSAYLFIMQQLIGKSACLLADLWPVLSIYDISTHQHTTMFIATSQLVCNHVCT